MSQLHCVLQRVALVCVVLLCFAFCNSGLRWSAYSSCVSIQGCAGLHIFIILQLRVALVCVFLFCFATQGCAGLRILVVFGNSGLRWSAYSSCVLQSRVRWSAYSYRVLQLRVALVCVFLYCVLMCFAIQGCAGLRILIAFCNSRLRWSAYSYVLQLRVAPVCVSAYSILCLATQGCAGLRSNYVILHFLVRSSTL